MQKTRSANQSPENCPCSRLRRTLIPPYVGFWFHCSPNPMIVAVERYASSDLLYELKAARDKLNSSSHNGLFLALFGTDPLVLR